MFKKWIITVTAYDDEGNRFNRSFEITEKELRSLPGREFLKIQYFASRAYDDIRKTVEENNQ